MNTTMRETVIQSLLKERESSHEDWMTMDVNEYNCYLRTLTDDELLELTVDD